MTRLLFAATTIAGVALAAAPVAAQSSGTVATWVQYAPGSSANALAAGSWGDMPASLSPTVLVRAVVKDATACPAAMLDRKTPLTMKQRFIGTQLTNTPGTTGATNGKAGYPQYFVQNTSAQNFANGTPMATTAWGECEAVVPSGHKIVTVDGVDMKLPNGHPKRIIVMADTGCRLNGALAANGSNQQNCSDPTAFPWAYLASVEASYKPDLIVQVGDWFYRDTNCLSNGTETFPGCNTLTDSRYETWGDTFDSWNADVFFPGQPLLASAPWVMVRGNHESCGRGARGWYATLDPFPYDYNKVICAKTGTYPSPGADAATYNPDFEPTYVVPLNGVNFLVHDSSFANDGSVDKNMAANYDIDLSNLLTAVQTGAPGSYNIFATHKPTFGLVYSSTTMSCAAGSGGTSDTTGDWTEMSVFNGGTGYQSSAFKNGVPRSISLFLSGHIHQFQAMNFGPSSSLNADFAPQLIVGTGGDLLDPDCTTGQVPPGNTLEKTVIQKQTPFVVQATSGTPTTTTTNAAAHDQFGFALLTANTDANDNVTSYSAAIYTLGAQLGARCRIAMNPRRISCTL